jgi:hypothetical protein
MNKFGAKQIAWLIPVAYIFHLADEYFTGFSDWFSRLFSVDLSLNNFILINSIGFTATILIAILSSFNKINSFVIAVLGTLFFVNGIIHTAATIFTGSYEPGTITGIFLYLALGYLILKKNFPLVPEEQRFLSVLAGIVIQIIVSLVAFNI